MFAGSSPLTRGTRIDSGQNDRFNRFIPAYAGNSAQGKACNLLRSVHPRLRGELAVVTAQRIVKSGSSPLTRGTRENSSPHEFHGRFIPAYAGNSVLPAVCMRDRSVHPRLRGELTEMMRLIIGSVGSSPLTRGTPPRRICEPRRPRFIPAYAGNSSSISTELKGAAVHPRLRGELDSQFSAVGKIDGSSPLTRGTRTNHQLRMHPQRFIPAYAGNSSGLATFTWVLPVHPRLRGELIPSTTILSSNSGSSPLTRGTLITDRPSRFR